MPPAGNVIRWGPESARCGPWRNDGSVGFLVPTPDGSVLSAGFVRRCMRYLAGQGYEKVVTGALAPKEHTGFLEAGFVVYERLHLLRFELSVGVPDLPPGPRLHRAGPYRRRQILKVDE